MTTLAMQSFFSYVEEENLPAIRAHLDKFKEVDSRSDTGLTALMLAAEQGSVEIVQELVRRGANVNLDDVDGWTALISAAKEGHVEVVRELLANNANLEHRDMGGWSALMWAAYKGRVEVARLLLEKGANPNITGQLCSVVLQHTQCTRNYDDAVVLLSCQCQYGTTPLIWAARKGHIDCVMHLLENGADVDQEGANSMTALIVAVRGGYTEVVKELLKRNPNVNMKDKDGNTALMIAAKEGHTEIVQDLLDAGAYVNIPDRSGDTVLIGAVRGGHIEIVRALLHKYADIDVQGQDNKTALYWAVEKGNATMVRDILQCNPDTETCTKDLETPLIKATKMRNLEIVELLLDKGAKVSAVDKKGDTALHIAIRGRSRKLAELLLRNPKDGRLLYRPNKAGETPYNIDCTHQKSILTQIFGAKHLSPTESDGDMLGYDLYSSALADILSEPTMQPPICVGLYAQWGSGKSFLLKKLEDEMKTFAGQQVESLFQFSWLVVFLTLLLCGSLALVLGFTVDPRLAVAVSLSLLALLYLFFVVIYFGGRRDSDSWTWAWALSTRLARHVGYLELLLKLMFVNAPELPEQTTRALPVRFLFTDYNRLSSVGGETSMAEMIATLSDACEHEFGFMATRLFRVFKTEETQGRMKWKKTCCVPSFVIYAFVLGCLIAGLTLLAIFKVDGQNLTVNAVLIAMASAVGLALVLNCRTWWQVLDSVLNSQRKRLHSAANRMHELKSEGFMKVLKCEVELMARMAKTIDGFTQNQTRLAVIIDGLDSCEQDKVLQMLDTVRVLFSKGPFIAIFASDPHIIIKAINQNLNSVLRDSNINGHDYMRNIVHLPVFLNSRGLSSTRKLLTSYSLPPGWHEEVDRKISQTSLREQTRVGSGMALNRRDTYRRRQMHRTLTRQMSFDLTKLLLTEDWFSDISPQSMRRLVNIVSVTGRLLRANQITFSWDRLASWINLTEEWPYRTSWLILFLEETDGVSDQMTLKSIYERISVNIPTTKDVEPLLEIDGDVRSFEVFLSSRTPVLTAHDVETFLPCTVNLDPKLREIIADVRAAREQMHMGGVTYPTLPLQDPPSRAPSLFSQHSPACSPASQCPGPFPPTGVPPPQPHSSYYSGLTGPQHPFYNRANANGRVLSQCNLDELKKEMNMNFGDWHLFKSMVMELRSLENQMLCETQQGAREQSSQAAGADAFAEPEPPLRYKLDLSFEELNNVGLDETQRQSNPNWTATAHRTPSMSSLNSQESANDICKLTDKQQAEYRDAYREYIAQMAQLEGSAGGGGGGGVGGDKTGPLVSEDKGKEAGQEDGKPATRRGGKVDDAADLGFAADAPPLDPITEEERRSNRSGSRPPLGHRLSAERGGLFPPAELKLKGTGLRYQKLNSDEDESSTEDLDSTPLLRGEKKPRPKGAESVCLSDTTLDKKESSDSGVRSSDSSAEHSLRDEEVGLPQSEGGDLIELEQESPVRMRAAPRNPSGPQEPPAARMSICSEAPSEGSVTAGSPGDGWPSNRAYGLNRAPSDTTLNNNNANTQMTNRRLLAHSPASAPIAPRTIIITPGSSTDPTTRNKNLRAVLLKKGLSPGDGPEVLTSSTDTTAFGEERESIL
uniref:Kinase D interacting substrate 220 n=1 Tax=Scleropages formosus TaxID=113540 RepID=A0A8C9WH12_SCLFO